MTNEMSTNRRCSVNSAPVNKEVKSPFRNIQWGWTKEQVSKAEKEKLLKSKLEDGRELLIFSSRILELDCWIVYVFINNKLVRAKYIITDASLGIWDYLPAFLKLKNALKLKYGTPKAEKSQWKNPERYKMFGHPEESRNAIDDGYIAYLAVSWESASTTIVLYADNEFNDSTPPQVEYTSLKLKYIEDELKKKKIINNF